MLHRVEKVDIQRAKEQKQSKRGKVREAERKGYEK